MLSTKSAIFSGSISTSEWLVGEGITKGNKNNYFWWVIKGVQRSLRWNFRGKVTLVCSRMTMCISSRDTSKALITKRAVKFSTCPSKHLSLCKKLRWQWGTSGLAFSKTSFISSEAMMLLTWASLASSLTKLKTISGEFLVTCCFLLPLKPAAYKSNSKNKTTW